MLDSNLIEYSKYFEVFSQKKRICPNFDNYKKYITANTTFSAVSTTTNTKLIYYNKKSLIQKT
jgi:hypothetical protein